MPPGTYAIVLSVPDEAALLKFHVKLVEKGVSHVVIRESEAPHRNQATAIGVLPKPRSVLKSYFSSLPLLKQLNTRQSSSDG